MALRVGINGFGRIGRNVLRAIIESERKDMQNSVSLYFSKWIQTIKKKKHIIHIFVKK